MKDDPGSTATQEPPVPRYAWYVLAVLTAIFGLATIDRAVVPLVLEPIRLEFGLNDAQLGLLSGLAFGVPYTLCAIPAGIMIDRLNRQRLLASVLAVWSVMTAFGGFAQNYLQLLLARIAVGGAEAGAPTAVSLIADYFPPRKRPMALSLYQSGGSIAMGVNFALGGWIAYEWGWRAAFLVVGIPGLVLALLVLLTVREPERGATDGAGRGEEPAPSYLDTVRHILGTPSAVHLFCGYILTNATISSFWVWSTSLLIRVHALNIRDAGVVVALAGGAMGFVGATGGAYVCARLANRGMRSILLFVTLASALMAPLGMVMALVPSLALAIVFMMLVSAAKSSFLGPCQGALLNLVGVRMRGVTATLFNALGTLVGFSIGPLLSGGVSYAFGGGSAIRIGLALLFLLNLWSAWHFWKASRMLTKTAVL